MAVSGAHPLTHRLAALDGLRGVAILLVMALHFVGQYDVATPSSSLAAVARAGWVGVDLFFVLSGYLITSILLGTKERPRYFAPFYWRRLLRIGPAYALVLAFFLWLASAHPTDSARPFLAHQPYYWTLTTNWLALDIGGIGNIPYRMGWTWSLSVEEQFYLVWPALVRWTPVGTLRPVLWVTVILAFATRVVFLLAGDSTKAAYTFTPCRLDALAAGALLAVCAQHGPMPRWLRYVGDAPIALWVGVAFVTYHVLLLLDPQALPHSVATRAIGFTFTAAVCALILGGALASPNGPLSHWCSWRPLRIVGKYSYALYLWHVTVNAFMYGLGIPRWVDNRTVGDLLYCVVAGAVTLVIALVSWFLVEYPVSQLKGRLFTSPFTAPRVSSTSHSPSAGGTSTTSAPSRSTS